MSETTLSDAQAQRLLDVAEAPRRIYCVRRGKADELCEDLRFKGLLVRMPPASPLDPAYTVTHAGYWRAVQLRLNPSA